MRDRQMFIMFDDCAGPHYYVYRYSPAQSARMRHLVRYTRDQRRAGKLWNVIINRGAQRILPSAVGIG